MRAVDDARPHMPSPVEPLTERLWVKRDDQISPRYGGNKARKLGRLFEEARERGARRIVTVGAAGSHQVVATAIHGLDQGFDVTAVLAPQPRTEHGIRNLRAALAAKLRPMVAPSWKAVEALARAALDRDAYFVPLGGSNAIGSLGLVDAATEIAHAVHAGEMPEPDLLVVALGSGGTAAGLAVGLEREGLKTRVVGVTISKPERLVATLARRMIDKLADRLELSASQKAGADARLTVDARWVGGGYALPTPEGLQAIAQARAWGLELEPTYTGKAFACALAVANAHPSMHILFLHTLSSASLAPWLDQAPELSAELARLFR